jgi:hypothetical protein
MDHMKSIYRKIDEGVNLNQKTQQLKAAFLFQERARLILVRDEIGR